MLWGQPINVFTDQKKHERCSRHKVELSVQVEASAGRLWALGLSIKSIQNTVADAILRLEYDPSVNQTPESYFMMKFNKNLKCSQRQKWMAVSKHLCKLEVDANNHADLNVMFANHGYEDRYALLLQ
jgi:hypothetical protein